MLLEIPIIVSRTKIDNYYFNDSLVRFFNPEDENDLANCMLELANNEGERLKLIDKSRQYVKNWTWEARKGDYLSIIR